MDPSLLPTDDDLLYEEELLRTPYNLTLWVRYLDARKDAPSKKRHLLYERALRALPGSYKLWHAYLRERLEPARGLPAGRPEVESLNNAFERALVTMHKMPRIWELYLRFLTDQRHLTRTRRAFDRALAALPVTQHDRVWVLYLVRQCERPPTLCTQASDAPLALLRRRLPAWTACPWRRHSGVCAPRPDTRLDGQLTALCLCPGFTGAT